MRENQRVSVTLWGVAVLLALSLFINYVDRGNLSIAAPLLKVEMGLSASQLGVLFSAFFWTYSFCLLLSGYLADHSEVKWLLAGGFLLWSAATLVTGFLHGFVPLLLARLVLGMGESTAYPSYSRILCHHFPEERRGFANAIVSTGKSFGPAVGTFAGSILMANYGWRPFFIVLGICSFLWLVPWMLWMPRDPHASTVDKDLSPGIGEILRQPSLWGTCGGLFGLNYLSYFMITWLPYYFVHERHFSLEKMGRVIGIAFVCMALASLTSGWIEDRLIAQGRTPNSVRKVFVAAGQVCAGVSLAACVVADARVSVICLVLAGTAFGVCDSNVWTITQTLAGRHASGKWTGFENFFGNLAGIAAPAIAGVIVDRTGNFFWAFALTGLMAVLGALCWVGGVSSHPVAWKQPAASLTSPSRQ
jgi:MFS transporter, ACS family, D-galactonate transporter